MQRRKFLIILGSSAAWPVTGRAQQPMPAIGFLRSTSLANSTEFVAAFRQGLREEGFVEGQSVAIEFRSANDRPDLLLGLAQDLVHQPVNVIVGNGAAILAAKGATRNVPLVFAAGGDPVRDGLVESMNRPEGNVTGVNFFAGLLGAKRLELLRKFVPNATRIAVLVNPNTPNSEAERKDIQAAAQAIGQQLIVLDVGSEQEIDTAFATLVQQGADALLVGSGPFLASRREQVVVLAARHSLPAGYPLREFARAGGLISYGASITEAYRQAGIYAGRILKGEKPADLPVIRSTKFELVINLQTAKTLNLEVPPQLLAVSDEVIE